jgi:GNAT superfamily N-acetyltransferase
VKHLAHFSINESLKYGPQEIPQIESLGISSISREEEEEIIHMASLIFRNVRSYEGNRENISTSDFSRSIKVTDGEKIIGCYLVKEIEIPGEGKGIEGFALCLLPEYRGIGLGRSLKDWLELYAEEEGYDFIFGLHFKGLNNIHHWIKRRDLYEETEDLYKTIKRIK